MSDRRLSLAVLLFLLAVYTLTYSGVFHSDDEMSVAAVAESLVKRGSVAIDQFRWNQDLAGGVGKYGGDGHLYSKYSWGAALAAAPFYLAALMLPALGNVQAAMLLNVLVTALTGMLVFLCARRLGVSGAAAMGVALLFGLATLAWPYAKYFFSEPLSGLTLLAAFYFLLCYRDERRWTLLLPAGLALAGSLAAKTANAAAIPLFFLLLAVYEWPPAGSGGKRDFPSSWYTYLRGLALRSVPLATPVLLAGLVTMAYNFLRFGAPLDAGYLPIEQFSGRIQEGLPGLLLSPGRGLIFYAPVMLLLIPAAPVLWRLRRAEAAFILVLAAWQTLLYARWHVWFGGWCWGPRFLEPLMPFLALALGPWLEAAWRRGRGVRLAVIGLAAVSALVQLLGLSVDFNLYLRTLLALHPEMRAGIAYLTVDDPRYSPLLGQWGLLQAANLDFAWLRLSEGTPWIEWRILGPALLFVALAILGLRACLRGNPWPRLLAVTLVVGAVATWQAAAWGDGRDRYGAVAQDYEAVFSQVQADSQAGDVMLFVDLDRSEILLNANKTRMPVYAPLQEKWPLKLATQSMLRGLAANGGRLWLITEDLPGAGSGFEHWLAVNAHRLQDQEIGPALVTLYAFPPAGAGVDSAPVERVGKTFGDVLLLEGYTVRPWPAQPGQAVQVVLYWRAMQQPAASYGVSLRLATPDGKPVWQRDGDPQDGYSPTSTWQPGQTVVDRRGFVLPADTTPGVYELSVVVYDAGTLQALEVEGGGQALNVGLAVGR
jgi:hypothetical protein